MCKQILATKELKVIIGGKEYDAILIPSSQVVDVDYRNCPEDHPKVQRLMEQIRSGEVT